MRVGDGGEEDCYTILTCLYSSVTIILSLTVDVILQDRDY